MINLKEMEFGDEIFVVKIVPNFNRERIKKVDEDGIEWFRYDTEKVLEDVAKYVYTGKTEIRSYGATGTGDFYADDEYFFYDSDKKEYVSLYEDDFGGMNIFLTLEEAEKYLDDERKYRSD